MNTLKTLMATVVTATIILGLATPATALAPEGISYQGYLTNIDGTVVDGDTAMSFIAYNVDIGGAPLWIQSETVTVENGLFSVTLGNPANPFPIDFFDTPVYIGLLVAGEELLPRRPLVSAPYSFKANDADTLGGATASSLDQSAHVTDTGNPHAVTAAQAGAASTAAIADLQTQLNAALASIAILQSELSATNANLATATITIGSLQASVSDNVVDIASNASDVATLTSSVSDIESNSVLALDGVLTLSSGDTALFTGVDVQIVNGAGGTPNGTGNLIVGYNGVTSSTTFGCSDGGLLNQSDCTLAGEVWALSHKSGSHNVVVGSGHNYSRSNGLVVGFENSILNYGAVAFGRRNRALALYSFAAGERNVAQGAYSSVSGGTLNVATGAFSSVSGGSNGEASGEASSVSGGSNGEASGEESSISGGWFGKAIGVASSISGGGRGEAIGLRSSISGGYLGDATGEASSITGGVRNSATARWATVSGGADRDSIGEADWRAGTLFENF